MKLLEFKGHTCDNWQSASISKKYITHTLVVYLSALASLFHRFCKILLQTDSDKLTHFYVFQLVGVRQSEAQFYIIKCQRIVCIPSEFHIR